MDFASNAQSRRFVWALELLHSKNCVSCSQFCSPHPPVPLTHRSLPPWLCHLRSQPCCRHLNHWSKLLFSKSYTLLAIQIDHTSPQFIVLNFNKSWTIQCNPAQGQNFFTSCGGHTRGEQKACKLTIMQRGYVLRTSKKCVFFHEALTHSGTQPKSASLPSANCF